MFIPVPKPKLRKQQRAVNNSRPDADRICTHESGCTRPYAERHEIFYGTKCRQLSIEYGLQKDLCPEHHRGPEGPHQNKEYDLKLKREAQSKFEETHSRAEWMKLIGRNYLEG